MTVRIMEGVKRMDCRRIQYEVCRSWLVGAGAGSGGRADVGQTTIRDFYRSLKVCNNNYCSCPHNSA
jgi:hypothetical protein